MAHGHMGWEASKQPRGGSPAGWGPSCPPEPHPTSPYPHRTEVPLQEGQSRPADDVQALVGVEGAPHAEDPPDELPGEEGEVGLAVVHGPPGEGKGAWQGCSCSRPAPRCSFWGRGRSPGACPQPRLTARL